MMDLKLLDRVFLFVGKILLYVLGSLLTVAVSLILFLYVAEWMWPELYGSHSLGDDFYMIEWNRNTKLIVYNSWSIRGRTCYGGHTVIPDYEVSVDALGVAGEGVIDAKSDDRWIVVKTMLGGTKRSKYYIIDKRFDSSTTEPEDIRKNYTYEYDDSIQLIKASKEKNIPINDLMPK